MIPSTGSDLVTVATYMFPWEAHITRGRLEAEGVAAFVADDNLVQMNWGYAWAIGGVRMQVSRRQLGEARLVLRNLDAGAYADTSVDEKDDSLRCPRCSSTKFDIGRSSSTLALILVALFYTVPLPLPKRHHCRNCGYDWSA
jgi:rubredoxin